MVDARGVSILMNTSSGGVLSFGPETEILPNVQATALLAGNFFVDAPNGTSPPSLVVADNGTGDVILMRGNGDGTFTEIGAYRAAPDITALAAGDLNRDGYLDVVAVSGSTTSTQQITTLLSNLGNGFQPPISTSIPLNVPLNSVALTDITPFNSADSNSPLDYDAYPDLVVGTVGGTFNGISVPSNLYTLTGNGDGSFRDPVPYEAGGEPDPAVVGVTSDPFVRVLTFEKGGDYVAPNLVRNGTFEQRDLNNEQGNLTGWQTAQVANSRGEWAVQTGDLSPLSQTPEPAPDLRARAFSRPCSTSPTSSRSRRTASMITRPPATAAATSSTRTSRSPTRRASSFPSTCSSTLRGPRSPTPPSNPSLDWTAQRATTIRSGSISWTRRSLSTARPSC